MSVYLTIYIYHNHHIVDSAVSLLSSMTSHTASPPPAFTLMPSLINRLAGKCLRLLDLVRLLTFLWVL
jgi:hypothetical protein